MNKLNTELLKLSGALGKQIDGLQELLKVASNLVDIATKNTQIDEVELREQVTLAEVCANCGHVVKEEAHKCADKEEKTLCCDASIVEQTGRCSKCLESV